MYLLASHLLAPLARPLLRKRLKRGKEHPVRWVEKLGLDLAPRPDGPVVWLHAVGLGEVLSLRGLIARMAEVRPDISFVVTSTTRISAEVLARQLPLRTVHQFLPIDAPRYRRRFLAHFRPALCVWAEQDLWPGLVSDLDAAAIPQCIVAARMNAASFQRHRSARGLYRDLYGAMAFITAQDADTATYLQRLGGRAEVTGSLKPAAPALACDHATLDALRTHLGDRLVWAVAPAHPEDVALATKAHEIIRQTRPDAVLIIAPRFADGFTDSGWPRRSKGALPGPADPIWLFDTFGELGLVYRLSAAALIGGTFSEIEGHNPWEAVSLGTVVMHGPRTANFARDYHQLTTADASFQIGSATDVATVLLGDARDQKAQNAFACLSDASAATDAIARRLAKLVKT